MKIIFRCYPQFNMKWNVVSFVVERKEETFLNLKSLVAWSLFEHVVIKSSRQVLYICASKLALVQIMAWHRTGAKLWSEPVLPHCQLNPKEHISMKLYSKIRRFIRENTLENTVCKFSLMCQSSFEWRHLESMPLWPQRGRWLSQNWSCSLWRRYPYYM